MNDHERTVVIGSPVMHEHLPQPRRRVLSSIAAAGMVLGAMMPGALPAAMKETTKQLDKPPRRMWTCRKCGGPFQPVLSPSICDLCYNEQWKNVGGGR